MTDRNLGGSRRFDADELGDGDWRELEDALAMGRALDARIDDAPAVASAGFTRRVMGAIASEPGPGPVGFMAPLRRRGVLAGFAASVRQAWAAIGSPGVPSLARATALAYVLVVALAGVALAGAATIGVGNALGIFGPARTPAPTTSPTATPILPPATLAPPTDPTETEPAGTEDPSASPEASDDHGEPGDTLEPGDDGGDNSGPGSSSSGADDSGGGGDNSGPGSSSSGSDDHSGSGSGGGSTPRPSGTPRPSATPQPSETPH